MADELSVSGLEHSEFVNTSGVIVMHPQHRLAQQSIITLPDLVAHPFIALNPEDASRRRLEQAMANQGLVSRPLVETPYSTTVCELALRNVGIGMAHPIIALDYLERGLKVRKLSIDVSFSGLLVFRPGVPLSENAKELLSAMRIQMATDLEAIRAALTRP